MKKVVLLLVVAFSVSISAQIAPTEGKRTLKVKEKQELEYLEEVYESFSKKPRAQHMKRLPKKLAKYGFTNVKITALGSVYSRWKGISISKKSVVLAKIRAGASIESVVTEINRKPNDYKFQVNFNSDQGFFKVRLSMFVAPVYIIKEVNLNKK